MCVCVHGTASHGFNIMKIIDWMIVIRIVCDLITFPSWRFVFLFCVAWTWFCWQHASSTPHPLPKNIASTIDRLLFLSLSLSFALFRYAKIRHFIQFTIRQRLSWRFQLMCICWTFSFGIRIFCLFSFHSCYYRASPSFFHPHFHGNFSSRWSRCE